MDPPERPSSPHTPPRQKGIPGVQLAPRPRPLPPRGRNLDINQSEIHSNYYSLPKFIIPSESDPGAMMPPPRRRREDQYQEMVDKENPRQAEQRREAHLKENLPQVQSVTRRLQSQLGIWDPRVWPIPRLPESRELHNDFLVETNTKRVLNALDDCKDYGVDMSRESSKGQMLAGTVVRRTQAQREPADSAAPRDEDEVDENAVSEPKNTNFTYKPTPPQAKKNKNKKKKKASNKDELSREDDGMASALSGTTTNVSTNQSISQGQTTISPPDHDRDETMPDDSSIPPSERPGFSPGPSQSLASGSSSAHHEVNNAEDDTAMQDADMASSAEPEADAATIISMPRSSEIGAGTSAYETQSIPDISDINSEHSLPLATQSEVDEYYANLIATAAAQRAASNDSTQSHKARRWANAMAGLSPQDGYDSDGNSMDASEWNRRYGDGEEDDDDDEDQNNNPNASSQPTPGSVAGGVPLGLPDRSAPSEDINATIGNAAFQDDNVPSQTQGQGKGKERAHSPTFEEKLANVPQSHGLDFINHIDEKFRVKIRTRNPTVPHPENMPGTLTEALFNYHHLNAWPMLTLTLEDVSVSMLNPKADRCVLLHHFEVGLDGVEAIVQGQVIIPETPEVTAEREERLARLGTRKVGDGGHFKSLKKAQQDKSHGKGWWVFYGVRFKQTKTEKKLRKPAKWLCFGAPIEAIGRLRVSLGQERANIWLGGGPSRSGGMVKRFTAEMKRSQVLMCQGGIAPMDFWSGAADWQDGVLAKAQDAMANNGLRLTFLFEDPHGPQATLTNMVNASNIAAKVSTPISHSTVDRRPLTIPRSAKSLWQI